MSNALNNTIKKNAMNTLSIYDSMSAQKRKFEPLQAGKVGMYVCGMTVYDYCHMGHARIMVAFDVIVRWLRHIGYDVTFVRNITDIDDKIIERAMQNNEPINELTQRFIKAMHEDETVLGCAAPDHEPKATEHIKPMQDIIQTLVDKKIAYPTNNGDVYYAVNNFAQYGKLSKRKLADMQAGARVEVQVESQKKNPFDFVLWKAAKPDEPQWASPWGQGRPGWHIECSAMSHQCLGETFDIHGGGHDLLFPHHENEIAQSEAANNCEYARNWMHVGFINVDGEKMSKSLGNFFTIRDVVAKYHPETVRFFLLSSHYRSQVNFSDATLNEAHNGLSRLYQAIKAAEQSGKSIELDEQMTNDAFASEAGKAFIAAMNDDFNTAQATSILFGLAREVNKAIKANDVEAAVTHGTTLKALASVLNILQHDANGFLQAVVGENTKNSLSDTDIDALIQQRADAKAAKDFATADGIREQLKQAGIELEDSRAGTTWRRM